MKNALILLLSILAVACSSKNSNSSCGNANMQFTSNMTYSTNGINENNILIVKHSQLTSIEHHIEMTLASGKVLHAKNNENLNSTENMIIDFSQKKYNSSHDGTMSFEHNPGLTLEKGTAVFSLDTQGVQKVLLKSLKDIEANGNKTCSVSNAHLDFWMIGQTLHAQNTAQIRVQLNQAQYNQLNRLPTR